MFGCALLSLSHLSKEFIIVHLLDCFPRTLIFFPFRFGNIHTLFFFPIRATSSPLATFLPNRRFPPHVDFSTLNGLGELSVVVLELLILLLTRDNQGLSMHQDVQVRLLTHLADRVQHAEGQGLEAVTQLQAEGRRDLLEHRDVPENRGERRIGFVVVTLKASLTQAGEGGVRYLQLGEQKFTLLQIL